MVAVIYQSVFYNTSGYATESRGLVRGLVDAGFAVRIEHLGREAPESLVPAEYRWLKSLEATPVDVSDAVFIGAAPPGTVRGRPAAPCAVLRTMYEADRIHPEWVERCDRFDEVWVPSEHSREAFVASGLPAGKVRILPGGVDTRRFRPEAPPVELARRKAFAFLSVFDWQWHKGWDLLVEAYAREFSAGEPVTLYLKVPGVRGRPEVLSELHHVLRQLPGEAGAGTPDIVLVDTAFTDAEMPGLYTAADAFVLPSRGEGYGRPFLEAMACGLPVIGTNWGGQTAFLDELVGYPLPIRGLELVPEHNPCEHRGLRVAAPDLAVLRRLMRHVYCNRDEARRKGEAARRRMAAAWDIRDSAAVMAEEVIRLAGGRGAVNGGVAAR
jgi:glycosyltransferase involved in cell wall biosynthesis